MLHPSCRLTLLDADALALAAAAENHPDAHCILSDGWTAMPPGERFDWIVSNPPIHVGRDEDYAICSALARRAREWLSPRGQLVAVTQRTVGLGTLFRETFRKSRMLAETPRYQVWLGRP